MAWNEPGGPGDKSGGGSGGGSSNGNRNPWGKRPQSGPPDLDEMARNLKRKLSGIFGGGNRGTSASGGGEGGGGLGVGVIVAVLLAIWALTGFYQVDQAERAVVLRFGKYVDTTLPGLNWRLPWPIDGKYVVNVERIESFTDETRMLTADENMVHINLAVQYRRTDPKLYVFRVNDPEGTLKEVSESAIREVVGRSTLGAVLESGRQEIAARTKELIQRTLSAYQTGIEVTSVNLQGVAVPEQVAPAQQDAIKAGNDKERSSLEAQTYASDILPKARSAAVRQVQDGQAYRARKIADSEGETVRFTKLLAEYERAPAVTRERLYLETLEDVLGGAKKVMIDTKSGGNMIYLPIDKLLEQSRAMTKESPRDPVVVTRAPQSSEAATDDRRIRGAR
ncbi:MAG TPA: FtsH protease activity modulator HflK [Steroidobacteraceae bacterium]|nr:FtsH protease activity modulator HflK [Steroidobacteraceae bacterium]